MAILHTNPILIVAAVLPAALLMFFVHRADKLEKEPTVLLWRLILWGVIATGLAFIAEWIGMKVLSWFFTSYSTLYSLLLNFLVIALSEEFFKYIVLKWRTWKSPYFDCRFDGIVYAVFVSLGFALWENIEYVAQLGLIGALIRALTAVPGHACFGVFMGAWYGAAKSHEKNGRAAESARCRKLAVICPALLHGLYDFIATTDGGGISWTFVGFVLIMFVAAFRMIRRLSKADHYL